MSRHVADRWWRLSRRPREVAMQPWHDRAQDDGASAPAQRLDILVHLRALPPRQRVPGSHRILSDDPRLLRLVAARNDPAEGIGSVQGPVAVLFGVTVETIGAVRRVQDAAGATTALAAPLPGERERPCAVVTPPLSTDHREALDVLLAPARDLGFTVLVEAAVHLHVDGGPSSR